MLKSCLFRDTRMKIGSFWKQAPAGRGAFIVSLIALILYLLTMNRTFGFIDEGELAAVAYTLGIAHPTGYPTLTLLGYLVTHLVPLRPVLTLNLFAALLTATSVGILTLLLDYLLEKVQLANADKRLPHQRNPNTKVRIQDSQSKTEGVAKRVLPPPVRVLYAGLTALMVAFTTIWWSQATGFEVYSLHLVMMLLVTLLFLRYVEEEKVRAVSEPLRLTKRGFWFALVLGLSFTNHLMTGLLLPAFALYYFWTLGFNRRSWKRLIYLIPPFLLGLLPYLYLPIRASMHPPLNWGDPDTWERFLLHVRGAQFGFMMFFGLRVGHPEYLLYQVAYFFNNLPFELAYGGLGIALLGIWYVARRSARWSLWILLIFLPGFLFASGYLIADIEPYYLTPLFAIGIWISMGWLWLHQRLGAKTTLGIAILLVGVSVTLHYPLCDESQNTLAEDMTRNMLDTLPAHSLILATASPPSLVGVSSHWNLWISGALYLQHVEGVRPDVVILNRPMLHNVAYLEQFEREHPTLAKPVQREIATFKAFLRKYEYAEFSSQEEETAYYAAFNKMVERIIEVAFPQRPVFVVQEVKPSLGKGYQQVPYHLAFRLVRSSTYLPMSFPNYRFRFWKRIELNTCDLYWYYAFCMLNRALYEAQYGHLDEALRYADLALKFDPGWVEKDVPDMPLQQEERAKAVIRAFEELRQKVEKLRQVLKELRKDPKASQ